MDNFFLDLHFHQVGGGVLHSLLDIAKKIYHETIILWEVKYILWTTVRYIISSIFQPVIIQLHNNCELNMSPPTTSFSYISALICNTTDCIGQ